MRQWHWSGISQRSGRATFNSRMTDLDNVLSETQANVAGAVVLDDGATTPSVQGASVLVTANTSATDVTTFADGVPGKLIIIEFGDGNTTLKHGANLQLAAGVDFTGSVGDMKSFATSDGTVWREFPQP